MSLSKKHRAIALTVVSPQVLDETHGEPPAVTLELDELEMMLAEAIAVGRHEGRAQAAPADPPEKV